MTLMTSFRTSWRIAKMMERVGFLIGIVITVILFLIVGLFLLPRSSMDDWLPIFLGWGYLALAVWAIASVSTLITLVTWRLSGVRFKLEFIAFLALASAATVGLPLLVSGLFLLAETGSWLMVLDWLRGAP